MPAADDTPTVCAPVPTAPVSVTVPGSATSPACPTSCCNNSVAPRTLLCICVRFHTERCDVAMCWSSVVTVPITESNSTTEMSSSGREKPAAECGTSRRVVMIRMETT